MDRLVEKFVFVIVVRLGLMRLKVFLGFVRETGSGKVREIGLYFWEYD